MVGMMADFEDVWLRLLCRSRSRQGITPPPFRWRYLLRWWGWRVYVLSRLLRLRWTRKKGFYCGPTGFPLEDQDG